MFTDYDLRMYKIYEELKVNYMPTIGEVFFFDLSQENYEPEKIKSVYNIQEQIRQFIVNKKPYALINYGADEKEPTLTLHAVTFIKEENLVTQEILFFRKIRPIDMETVKMELKMLGEMLNSKSS